MPDPEKWYLNLPSTYPDGTIKKCSGLKIKLAATPSRAIRNSRDPKVDWTVDYEGSPDAHAPYVVAPAFSVAQTGLVDGQFTTELTIPVVNGRKYTITAKRTGNNAVVFTKQYETWQRIYYTVHYMNTACRDAFNAIKDELHAMFAKANIELRLKEIKQCRKGGRDVNEASTTGENDLTLPHTWEATDLLARRPNHIRMVVARDLTHKNNSQIEWTMNNQTAARAGAAVRASSTGVNHGTVVYENDITTFNPATPFSAVEAFIKLDPAPLPPACVSHDEAQYPHRALKIDLSADPSLAGVYHHFGNTGATFTGRVDGRRCVDGWADAYEHQTTATLGVANDAGNPVTVGSAKLWLAGNTVVIDDPRMILDANDFARSIKVVYAATTVNLANATAARTNEHRVTVDLSGQPAVTTHLAGAAATITFSLARRGALAKGDVIGATERVAFSVEKISSTENYSVTNNGIIVTYKNDKMLKVSSVQLMIVNPGDLAGNFAHLSVPVAIPAAAISGTNVHHAEINLAHASLTGTPALAALGAAMQQGRYLTFKATLDGHESLGGYSPDALRWFIGLNALVMPNQTQAQVRKRLKLTIAHEIGHSLKLTRKETKRLPNTNVPNDRWYTNDHGGVGNHCHQHAILVAAGAGNGRQDTKSGQIYVYNAHAAGKLCIMYHDIDYTNMGDEFCDRCLEHIKRGIANFGSPP